MVFDLDGRPDSGESRFGAVRQGIPGIYVFNSGDPGKTDPALAGKGTVMCFVARSSTGVPSTVFFWASADGKLRTGTSFPSNTEAGTVVGSQT